MLKDMKPEDRFVAFLSTIIVVGFSTIAVASMFFPVHPESDIKQTMIALVMLAAGYYLGSSAGSKAKDAPMIAKALADASNQPPNGNVPPVSTTTTVTDNSTVTRTEPSPIAPPAPVPPLVPAAPAPAPQI